MQGHRVRLNDRELALIAASLRARKTGVSDRTAAELEYLAQRLEEMAPGNPYWRFGPSEKQSEPVG